MSHSYNRIWIHSIWATKDRLPLILPSIEQEIYSKMHEEFTYLGCKPRIINGMPDHVHSLFLLSPQKPLTDIIKQIKGAVSYWINEQNLTKGKFLWQTGYASYSVSESVLDKVYWYIANQKKHHKKITFLKEYDEFIKIHGMETEQIA